MDIKYLEARSMVESSYECLSWQSFSVLATPCLWSCVLHNFTGTKRILLRRNIISVVTSIAIFLQSSKVGGQ
jgi:hypothetical protein